MAAESVSKYRERRYRIESKVKYVEVDFQTAKIFSKIERVRKIIITF